MTFAIVEQLIEARAVQHRERVTDSDLLLVPLLFDSGLQRLEVVHGGPTGPVWDALPVPWM